MNFVCIGQIFMLWKLIYYMILVQISMSKSMVWKSGIHSRPIIPFLLYFSILHYSSVYYDTIHAYPNWNFYMLEWRRHALLFNNKLQYYIRRLPLLQPVKMMVYSASECDHNICNCKPCYRTEVLHSIDQILYFCFTLSW